MKRKFNYLWLTFLIVCMAMESIAGQNTKNDQVYFSLPDDNVLIVNVSQSKSPMQFENINVFFDKKGTVPIINWKLKNNSSKTIKRFVVAFKIRTNINQWEKVGKGQTEYDIGTDEKNDLIYPQKTYQEINGVKVSLLPQNELRNLFSYDKDAGDDMYVIVYGMIKKIVFDDGSTYEEDNMVFREF